MHTHMQQLQEDCNTMDKGFKRDIQTLCNTTFDQDALKQLTWLYRKRDYRVYHSLQDEEIEEEGEADPHGGDDYLATSAENRRSKRGGQSMKQSKRGGQSMKASSRQSKAGKRSSRGSAGQSHVSG